LGQRAETLALPKLCSGHGAFIIFLITALTFESVGEVSSASSRCDHAEYALVHVHNHPSAHSLRLEYLLLGVGLAAIVF
jgi:hypothetical protein